MPVERYLKCGKIVGTHGIGGKIKIRHWCDSPEFLLDFRRFFIDGSEYLVRNSRVHKESVLVSFYGIDDLNAAMSLKNKTVCIIREDSALPEGSYFLQDALGLPVYDVSRGHVGILKDVIEAPGGHIFVIEGKCEHLVPDVPEFIKSVDIAGGRITVSMIEGM